MKILNIFLFILLANTTYRCADDENTIDCKSAAKQMKVLLKQFRIRVIWNLLSAWLYPLPARDDDYGDCKDLREHCSEKTGI